MMEDEECNLMVHLIQPKARCRYTLYPINFRFEGMSCLITTSCAMEDFPDTGTKKNRLSEGLDSFKIVLSPGSAMGYQVQYFINCSERHCLGRFQDLGSWSIFCSLNGHVKQQVKLK